LIKSGIQDKLTVEDTAENAKLDENGNKKPSHCTRIKVLRQVSLKNDK
jgi:hypothetical protein